MEAQEEELVFLARFQQDQLYNKLWRKEGFGQEEMFNRVLGGKELEQEIDKGVRGSHCKEAVLHTDGHHLLDHLLSVSFWYP